MFTAAQARMKALSTENYKNFDWIIKELQEASSKGFDFFDCPDNNVNYKVKLILKKDLGFEYVEEDGMICFLW